MRDFVNADGAIDYDAAVHLDAEDLAEQGVGEAYRRLHAGLAELGVTPLPILEQDDGENYSVECGGRRYPIFDDDLDEDGGADGDPWGRATFALFDIVNSQLGAVEHKLYAISGGNDMFGMFLTPAAVERARAASARKAHWPYLPTDEPEWGGFPH